MKNRTFLTIVALLISLISFAQEKLSEYSQKNYEKGKELYTKKEYGKALPFFSKVIGSYPNYAKSYFFRGLCYKESNKEELALLDFNHLLNTKKLEDKAQVEIGKIYMNRMNLKKALESFNKAKLIQPNNPSIYYQEGILRYKQKKYDLAIESFTTAIKHDSKKANYYNNRAGVYMKQNSFKKALADYKKAIKIKPNSKFLKLNLANCHLNLNALESSLKEYKDILKTSPNDHKIYNKIGIVYLRKKETKKAKLNFDKALELNPNYAKSYVNLASCHIYEKNYIQAMEMCNNSLKINPNLSEAYYNLGVAYEGLEDFKSACQNWVEAASLGSSKAIEHLNSSACQE